MTLPVHPSLAYVNRLFAGTIAIAVQKRLGQIPVSADEDRLFHGLVQPPRMPGRIGRTWQFYNRYQVQATVGVLGESPGGFIGYTQLHAGTPTLPGFLRWSAHKLLRTS